jgi:hypothetical protein
MQILHDVRCLFHLEHEHRVDWAEESTDHLDWTNYSAGGPEQPAPEIPDVVEPPPPLIWDELAVFGLVDPGAGDPSGAATLSDLSGPDRLGAMGLLGARTGGPRTRRSLAACSPFELLGALSLSTD